MLDVPLFNVFPLWFLSLFADTALNDKAGLRGTMAGFLDNVRWPECECVDWSERRNAVASVVAGVLVSESPLATFRLIVRPERSADPLEL